MNASDIVDEAPYTEDEWTALIDALYSHPVDSSTLRNLLDEALITLSAIASVSAPDRDGDVYVATWRLRKTKQTLDRTKEKAV